ncbi:MAG: nucleotide exchange factor GrpE [Patescibacteria group bacterium]
MSDDIEKKEEEKLLEGVDETKDLREKLEQCEKQRDEYLAGWQRAKADFINYRKEEMARLQEVAKYGAEDLIRECITVIDSFDLGIRALEKQGAVEKGVYMIRAQVEDMLRKRGVERIPLKSGEEFDPTTSEAVAEVQSDLPTGAIVEEIEAGYRLHEKIVRPARVTVSKGR